MSEETTTLGVDDSLLESVARCLDTNSVRALSELKLDDAVRARLDVLAQEANEGQLAPEEAREYERVIDVSDKTRSGNTRSVESSEVSPVSFCEECGEDLHKVPCEGHERRTQIDIVFEKVVTNVDVEIKSCPHCGTEARGAFPEAFCGPLLYGAGIKAYALNLLIAQMLSLKRVQQSLETVLGQVISEATILKYVLALHLALESWEKAAIGHRNITHTVRYTELSPERFKNFWKD
jgi:hypothetical protein